MSVIARQYHTSEELKWAIDKNQLTAWAQKYGWKIGFVVWIVFLVQRALLIPSILLSRFNIGRSVYGGLAVPAFYILMVMAASISVPSSEEELSKGQEVVHASIHVVKSMPDSYQMLVDPFIFLEGNPPMAIFTWAIYFLVLVHKIAEQLLKAKPKFRDRGQSFLRGLIKRPGERLDWGILQRYIEPVIFIGLGVCVYIYAQELHPQLKHVGAVLGLSGVCLLWSESVFYNRTIIER